MYDLNELEKKCKKYRLKKFFKLFILVVLLLFVAAFLYFNHYKNKPLKKQEKSEIKTKDKVIQNSKIKKDEKRLPKKEIKKREKKNNKYIKVIQFSSTTKNYEKEILNKKRDLEEKGFNCYIKESADSLKLRCLVPDDKILLDSLKKDKISYFYTKEDYEYIIKKGVFGKKTVKDSTLKNSKQEEQTKSLIKTKESTIEELKKIYEKRKDYKSAILIAKKYFKKGKYSDSLHWAKIANKIDNNKEESWILYAKSLYNLGKKDVAKDVLKIFLEYKNCYECEKLLKEWEKDDKKKD